MKDKILTAITSPKELEALYQESPEEFQREFQNIFSEHPESLILQTWNERLMYKHELATDKSKPIWLDKTFFIVLILTGIGGTLFNIFINNEEYGSTEWFFSRIFFTTPIILLMIYFLFHKTHTRQSIALVAGLIVTATIYLILLPNQHAWDYEYSENYRIFTDALSIVELHVPIFLWLVAGISFVGSEWRTNLKWLDYLKYNGEFLVYITLISISTIVLSGITLALLGFIEESSELSEWYVMNVVMYEIAAAPLISTFLIEKITGKRLRIAQLLAKIFSPLFLITTIAYLLLMAVYRSSPYSDRETLITFNFLMLLVLGMSIFSIVERNPQDKPGIFDYINIGLVSTTTIINLIVLSAILFRIFNDIFTPNRIAVLGINILVFTHLVGILIYYIRFLFNKTPYEKLESWIVRYLPVYAAWTIIISITIPFLFWYK